MRKGDLARRVENVGKVENYDVSLQDKIDLRRRVLEAVGGRVFDAFAGEGVMWSAVWSKAPGGYVGCDERYLPDERECYVADFRRVMRQIDLQAYSIFDFDSYGSPWESVVILSARRKVAKGERVGLVLTEGSGLKLHFGMLPGALAQLAGMRGQVSGAVRGNKELAARAIATTARRMNCTVERIWRAERNTGSAMLYFGVVLVGK